MLYKNKKRYLGSFIQRSDSSSVIQIEPDSTLSESIIADIKKYQSISVNPVYYFHQKKLADYMSASLHSSRFVFNKPLNVLLTINSSGIVTNVEFPKDKNNLDVDEESELYWIYSTMPRWQPFFYKNKVIPVQILLSNNTTLSTMSFEH